MSKLAIRVDGLSKRYLINHQKASGGGLRHAIQDTLAAPFKRLRNGGQSAGVTREEFWALKDINFEVQQGDVVGIIGRNGAGKSTLLKLLSRITEPTQGRIEIHGRVASLLEVGTGFHPELTGRENIFLNGAVLGMTRAEIKSKFDEIVAFSGVEKFLDTPVKRYSSGMYVRLAFSVAAHLEPEILVVDEVLAVGDMEFQRKCLGKMKQVAGGGRTVLFVSHNMAAISSLCNRAILMRQGCLVAYDETKKILPLYTEEAATKLQRQKRDIPDSRQHIRTVRPLSGTFQARMPLRFEINLCPGDAATNCHFALHILDQNGINVITASTQFLNSPPDISQVTTLNLDVENPSLVPGSYRIDAFIHASGIVDKFEDAARFSIEENVADSKYNHHSSDNAGLALADFSFTPRF